MSLFCFFFSFLSVCKNQKSELQVRPPPLCTLAHLFKGLFMWDFPLSMRISWTFDSLPGKLNVFFSAFSAAGFSQSLLFLLLRKKKKTDSSRKASQSDTLSLATSPLRRCWWVGRLHSAPLREEEATFWSGCSSFFPPSLQNAKVCLKRTEA